MKSPLVCRHLAHPSQYPQDKCGVKSVAEAISARAESTSLLLSPIAHSKHTKTTDCLKDHILCSVFMVRMSKWMSDPMVPMHSEVCPVCVCVRGCY